MTVIRASDSEIARQIAPKCLTCSARAANAIRLGEAICGGIQPNGEAIVETNGSASDLSHFLDRAACNPSLGLQS
jgi:hypothetical protein